MSGLVFGLEWRLARARRRLFVLNTAVPLIVVAPIALGAAPTAHAAAVYAVLFVLFGTFGTSIPLIRDGERGMVARVARTRVPSSSYLFEKAAAGALVDSAQLLPALLVIAAAGRGGVGSALAASVVLAATLFVTSLLGIWVAALARSLGEGALFSAVTGLLLLHASGVFRTPGAGSVGAAVEAWSPFRALHEVLLQLAGGPEFQGAAALMAWTVGLGAATALVASRVVRSLARSADASG